MKNQLQNGALFQAQDTPPRAVGGGGQQRQNVRPNLGYLAFSLLLSKLLLLSLFACNRAETPQVGEPPPAALDVLAVTASDGQVLLTWEGGAEANLAGYNVY
ncbi:MAG: hypothetical protein M3511_00080, partial [Deinococcota bacterium]|nr:hypothetical protein [Deinococcota bacterium]